MPIAYTDVGPISDVPYRFVTKLRDLAGDSEVLISQRREARNPLGIVEATNLTRLALTGSS